MDLSDETVDIVCGSFQDCLAMEHQVIPRWEKLDQFRKSGEFCDIQIQSADECHPAHKCVLASASLYFRTLFTSPVSNCQDMIDLSEFSAETINFILDRIYGTRPAHLVRVSNLTELLQLADFIQFEALLDIFYQHICDYFKVYESYEWYLIGKMSGITMLTTIAKGYIMSHYDSVQKLEKYKDSLPLIEEIISVKETEFTEEIVMTTENVYDRSNMVCRSGRQNLSGNKKMQKVNIANRTVESINHCLNNFHIRDNEGRQIESLQVISFFVFKNNIMSVSSRKGIVYLQKHDHLPPEELEEPCTDCSWCCSPLKELKIGRVFQEIYEDPSSIISLFQPILMGDLFLESTFYNGIECLYLIFRHIDKEFLVILKADLKSLRVSKNWITIKREIDNDNEIFQCTQTMVVLVQTKLYGTILINNDGGMYNIESFDFERNTKNHTPELLVFRMEGLCKKVKREIHLTHRMETFSSFCCNGEDIYLISTNCYNEHTVDIHWFDVKNKTWVKCSSLDADFKPRISQSFTYQKNLYVVVQDVATVPSMETHCTITDRGISYSSNQDYSGEALYQELYRFDTTTNSLTKVDIKLPSNPTFTVIPAYFSILHPYSRF